MQKKMNHLVVIACAALIIYAAGTYFLEIFNRKSISPAQSAVQMAPKGPIEEYNSGKFEKAMKQLKPLAQKGDPTAQFYVGAMYFNGEGVKKDNAVAYMWMTLSKNAGSHLGIEGIKKISTEITKDEKERGEKMINQWKNSH